MVKDQRTVVVHTCIYIPEMILKGQYVNHIYDLFAQNSIFYCSRTTIIVKLKKKISILRMAAYNFASQTTPNAA